MPFGVKATEEKPTEKEEVLMEEEIKEVLMCTDEVRTVKDLMEEAVLMVEELMVRRWYWWRCQRWRRRSL